MEITIPKEILQHLSLQSIDVLAFEKVQYQKPIISIRANKHKVFDKKKLPIIAPIAWNEYGYYLSEKPFFSKLPAWHCGSLYVQEASSMFLGYLWQQLFKNATNPKNILELCAAPGGKTTLLENLLVENDFLVANETIRSRIKPLLENVIRWGAKNTIITNNDAKDFAILNHFFDILVVDAPCSGSGLFRKIPTHTHAWNMDMVWHCAERQKRILIDSIPSLKNDGYLIYSTCSFSEEENEMMLDFLIEQGFESVDINVPENFKITKTFSPIHQAVGFRFYPHLLVGEGFFIACLKKKKNDAKNIYFNVSNNQLLLKSKMEIPHLITYHKEYEELIEWKNELYLIPKMCSYNIHLCLQYLKVQYISTPIGVFKGKDFVPHHAIAMRSDKKNDAILYELSEEEATIFIQKNSIEKKINTPNGWLQACYKNNILGWLKSTPTTLLKNYYPILFSTLKI